MIPTFTPKCGKCGANLAMGYFNLNFTWYCPCCFKNPTFTVTRTTVTVILILTTVAVTVTAAASHQNYRKMKAEHDAKIAEIEADIAKRKKRMSG